MRNFTIFEYLYRDGGNNKAHGDLLLEGEVNQKDEKNLRLLLNGGEWFIAEQVGVPVLCEQLWRHSNGPTEEDHDFHEFFGFRKARVEDVNSLDSFGRVSDLIKQFEKINNHWDISQSIYS